jgi:hypothetical protein
MDLSVLQRDVNNLEASLDSLEVCLLVATGLVVLGLILEYWHEIPEAINELRKAWSWKPICIIAGGILITLGVAGELYVQFIASGRETALRKANDAVFAGLNTEAAKARKDAGAAIERASSADERASKNEEEAARLRKVAEQERLARIKIEESVAWRRLTKAQQSRIGTRLSRFAGQQALLQYDASDIEAGTFALDIALALQLAKWRVSEPLQMLQMREGPVPLGTNPPIERGVTVVSTGDEASHKASEAIRHELSHLGFDSVQRPQDDPRKSSVVFIIVEHRPEGAQGEAKIRKQHH